MECCPSPCDSTAILIPRRDVLKAFAAAPLALGLSPVAEAATLKVRYDAASSKGQEMLAIYAAAVPRMQALGPTHPMSWMWQWYTHFVDGSTTKTAEMSRIFGSNPSTLKTLANDTWDTCQPHSGQNYNNFFPWHRLFVYYFERIVRQVSGRSDFTLPYWDYTSSDPAKRGVLPPQFILPDDPVFGSLYRPERSSLANSGLPIQQGQPGDPMDISDALLKTTYSNVNSVQGFCRAIDSGIHGRIHVLVGNGDGMGTVPYACNDPLFWVHHSNIDRMWASWNRTGGKNPTTAPWASASFVFADVKGVRATRKLSSAFNAANMGYTYDALIPRPVAPTTTLAATSMLSGTATLTGGSAPRLVGQARAGANLGASAVDVDLLRIAGSHAASVLGLDAAHPEQRCYVVLKGLHAWAQPEVLYHLYLRPARAQRLQPDNYVGNINFFDAEFHDHGGGAMAEALGENFYSFDVTSILQRLARNNVHAPDSLLLTIVPGGRPNPNAKPLVASMQLIRQ
ncbi:tyrosinase family protein [Cognatiluteimonas profundi]|uniref:tyrosinase family protein n=1 Tax=Cognatiluteimonas profundi TaxID=2594501 RepID=UPI00131C134C|nr:tyrosinase family protein [Lysobacter profundi]